ncbi:MAG: hypothetical protein RMN52_03335 [Anaerolineae bacterium]|nr:hypothetical protein [Candidatus Roseilinea sp.]MDW8449013.1 hypothetical protein [Anaerolineae bacterium]
MPTYKSQPKSKTIADLLRLVETHQPNIVVMDAVLPDADFMNAIRDVLAKPNPAEILIFSLGGRAEVTLNAFQIGVRGYLLYCEDFSLIVCPISANVNKTYWPYWRKASRTRWRLRYASVSTWCARI